MAKREVSQTLDGWFMLLDFEREIVTCKGYAVLRLIHDIMMIFIVQ